MKKIAIKPHKTRGIELIEILERMGGHNSHHLDGFSFRDDTAYLINENGIITSYTEHLCHEKGYKIYTLEEWENEYKSDDMIEGLVEEENGTALNPVELKSNANSITQYEVDVIEKAKNYWDSIKDAWVCPDGYEFKDENGNVINATKIVLEKKKKEVILTQEQIDTMVHESCVLFCKHCGCGVPREICTSLGTCKDHDEYRKSIRTHFESTRNNYGTNKERLD